MLRLLEPYLNTPTLRPRDGSVGKHHPRPSFAKQRYMAILKFHAIYQNMALPIYEADEISSASWRS